MGDSSIAIVVLLVGNGCPLGYPLGSSTVQVSNRFRLKNKWKLLRFETKICFLLVCKYTQMGACQPFLNPSQHQWLMKLKSGYTPIKLGYQWQAANKRSSSFYVNFMLVVQGGFLHVKYTVFKQTVSISNTPFQVLLLFCCFLWNYFKTLALLNIAKMVKAMISYNINL